MTIHRRFDASHRLYDRRCDGSDKTIRKTSQRWTVRETRGDKTRFFSSFHFCVFSVNVSSGRCLIISQRHLVDRSNMLIDRLLAGWGFSKLTFSISISSVICPNTKLSPAIATKWPIGCLVPNNPLIDRCHYHSIAEWPNDLSGHCHRRTHKIHLRWIIRS